MGMAVVIPFTTLMRLYRLYYDIGYSCIGAM